MTAPETVALIALLRIGRRPWPIYAELLEEAGGALPVLERELTERDDGQASLLPRLPDALYTLDAPNASSTPDGLLEAAAADVAGWEAHGIQLLTVLDRDYPNNLRAVHDRPPVIFVAGTLERRDTRSLAVVGSRRASPTGLEQAREIVFRLVHDGYVVTSGLAAGIDTAAHSTTLAAGGRTLAVIGTGLAHSYPRQNAALQREIAARGAVVSQFRPEIRPSRRTFPLRNAVMSGLTLGTVIVEASHTSGARVQARLALAHGRPVFLARPLLSQDWARELSDRPGTHVFSSPSEITDVIERLTSAGALVA
ncbi:MAG: DNA-processing protein DprA [Solirubrobacteraceae bacterium]